MRRSIRSRRGIALLAALTGVAWWSTPLVTRAVSNLSAQSPSGSGPPGYVGGKVWQVPPTIDPTGTKDVTAHLNNWLRQIPDYSTVTFPEKARYRAEGTVVLQYKHHVVIDGHQALLFANTDGSGMTPTDVWFVQRGYPTNRSHFVVWRSNDITVANLRIAGPNTPGGPGSYQPRLEGQSGIKFGACTNCNAWGNSIRNVHGDGIEVDFGSDNVSIVGNRIWSNGRQGITLAQSNGVVINANHLELIGRSVIDIEPGPLTDVRNVAITNNTVVAPVEGIFVAAEGDGGTDKVQVIGNYLVGLPIIVRDETPAGRPHRKLISVLRNRTTYGYDNYPAIGMMVFNGIDGVTVEGNVGVVKPDEAVRTRDSTAVVVRNNSWQR